MKCPKCHGDFAEVKTKDGVVDRCKQCHGLWFDNMEHEDFKPRADAIDLGANSSSTKLNRLMQIACPKCPNTQLLRMVDPKQPHIWFESCPICYSRFYDAGEFKDFAQIKLSELFWRKGVERS